MTQVQPVERPPPRGIEPVAPDRYWWAVALAGALGVAAGIVVLVAPGRSLTALAVIAGIYLLLAGAFVIARTFTDDRWGPGMLFLGLLALLAGVLLVRHPQNSVVVVSMALGMWFVVAGALDAGRVIIGPHRLLAALRAVVLLAAGIAIVSSPHISVRTLGLFTGLAICLQGAFQVAEALTLRRSG